jgi:hypothetical protein
MFQAIRLWLVITEFAQFGAQDGRAWNIDEYNRGPVVHGSLHRL